MCLIRSLVEAVPITGYLSESRSIVYISFLIYTGSVDFFQPCQSSLSVSVVMVLKRIAQPIPKRQPARPHLQRPRQSLHCIHRWQLPPLLNVPDGRVTDPRELPEPDKAKTGFPPGLKQTSPESRASHRC